MAVFLLFGVAALPGQPISLSARDAFNVGVREFQAGQFKSSAQSFARAVERAPNLLNARVYLAAALVQAYEPDDPSAENAEVGKSALAACEDVLKRDPNNVAATDSIATLYFQMREFVRSKEWNLKVLALSPDSKTSLYMLGAINWSEFGGVLKNAREAMGMSAEDPGPLRDDAVREKLKAQYLKSVNEGIEFERSSLAVDAEFGRAMMTMSYLLKARADLGDAASYAADMAEAADWAAKAAKTAGGK